MYVIVCECIAGVLSNVKSSAVNLSYQSTNLVNELISLISPMNQSRQSPEASLQCLPLIRARRWLRSRSASASASLHPPCNASLRGWESGARSRSRRVLRACRRFFLWRRRRLARAGLRFARWGLASARPLVSAHGLADRSPLPSLPHKPPRSRSAASPPCPCGMPLATLDLICSANATQIELSICPLPLLRHQEWQPNQVWHRRKPRRHNFTLC